jgi:hypothetical protein
MKARKHKNWPKASNANRFPDEHPDATKCSEQKSRRLAGKTAGDRGACEKESSTQGGE